MDSMDVKGIAWVGNIYQKFEAMCLEVEEAMCQETAKYVENQVQTVGASMKKFCSDVMQDLLPPSSKDLSKVASAELLLNPYLEFGIHMKPISTFKEDVLIKDQDPIPVHVKGIYEDKNGISEDKLNSSNDAWEDWSFNWDISDQDEAKCVEASNEDIIELETRGGQEGQICNLVKGASPTLTTKFAKSSRKGVKRSKCISSNNIIRTEHTNTATCESSELEVSEAHSNTSSGGDVSHSDPCENSSHPTVSANTQCGQSVDDELLQSHTGSSASAHHDHPDLEQEDNTTTGDIYVSESGFEETCVLVDGNDYHHPIPIPINHNEQTRCSYKKKIQGAFSLKKKSARKQEYKQLQYDNNLMFSDNKKPNSIDSEWELL
ncbi:unnamed protein product [Lactuca virosa]|uniref:Uncharacterized protein n=1 Tax=Lactuca virosa TaxID=75947 RepID=A0AAU9LSL3_9ASTR|nr:unnamed protein product [Lactuca virosa]